MKFADPPIRTEFVGAKDSPSYPWEQWFQAITNFLSAPQIPRFTPVSSSAIGVADTITHDDNFVYVCTKANTWKRIALGSF